VDEIEGEMNKIDPPTFDSEDKGDLVVGYEEILSYA